LQNLSERDQAKIKNGNALLKVSIAIIRLCNKYGVPWILENPKTSRAWLTPQIKKLAETAVFNQADYCQYKMPWKKATYFLCGGFFDNDFGLKTCSSCKGLCSATGKQHIILQGKDGSGNFLTAKAQPYPHALCRQLASNIVKNCSPAPP